MADSATMAPGPPSHGPNASTTLQLEVNTLAGGCLAAIPDAQGSWHLSDVLGRLPEVLPGHRYQLLKGEAVLAPGTAIAEWARPVDGRACVTAVVVAAPSWEEQRQLDLALIDSASELNVEKVRELLISGAGARVRMGFPTMRTALRAACDACGPHRPGDGKDAERDEEEEARLQAVLGALLSARADVNAKREDVGLGWSSTCAIHSAVQRGSFGAVRVLLDARASVDAVCKEVHLPTRKSKDLPRRHDEEDMEGESTALHIATQASNLPLAALLLERGANVNAVRRHLEREEGEDGGAAPALFVFGAGADRPRRLVRVHETALHLAVAGGHQALVDLLVQAGADASIARFCDGKETSVEELCSGNLGMLAALKADASTALIVRGGALEAEVDAALAGAARGGETTVLGG